MSKKKSKTKQPCTIDSVKPSFLLPPVAGGVSGCLSCGYTEELLPMRTRLYSGFGGWKITKNGKLYFNENREYNEAKTLSYIERMAKLEPECDWRANLDLPLRSATYQRHGKSKWVLIKSGQGFA